MLELSIQQRVIFWHQQPQGSYKKKKKDKVFGISTQVIDTRQFLGFLRQNHRAHHKFTQADYNKVWPKVFTSSSTKNIISSTKGQQQQQWQKKNQTPHL